VYPARSDWASSRPDSAWFLARSRAAEGGEWVEQVVQSEGLILIGLLQDRIVRAWESIERARARNGHPFHFLGFNRARLPAPRVDGRWGSVLQQYVYAFWRTPALIGRGREEAEDVLKVLVRDASRMRLSPRSLAAGMTVLAALDDYAWMPAFAATGQRHLQEIVVPDGAIPPVWGAAPPVPFPARQGPAWFTRRPADRTATLPGGCLATLPAQRRRFGARGGTASLLYRPDASQLKPGGG
jgi:hypothetical protein